MLVQRKICVLVPLIAAVCACAGSDTRYPSLAMRPFETAPPNPASPPHGDATRPLVDVATLDRLVGRAVAADEGFARQQRTATGLVRSAAGQSFESNARAAALLAMADLAARRGATSAVLADLDLLAADSATTLAPTGEIETARARVAALVEGQDAAIARLWQDMGQ